MSTYTVTLYDRDYSDLDEYGRRHNADGRWTHPHGDVTREEYEKARAKIESAYRGPWCPDCGKKGTKCRNREVCRRRAITGVKTTKYVALPRPSDEWMASRGYGTMTDRYHAGGRWKHGDRMRLVHYLTDAQLKDAYQHYAYELAMGRAGVENEVAA